MTKKLRPIRGDISDTFRDKLRAYCEKIGADPFEFMADTMKSQWIPLRYRLECARELARYLEPQLKAVEIELAQETRKAILFRYGSQIKEHEVRQLDEAS